MRIFLSILVAIGLGLVSATDATAQSCPNEALRSELRSGQLPDCRAYELVTPVYKEGQVAASTVFALTADGAHLIGTSFGVFGGASEDRLGAQFPGAVYEFSRTPEGWRASSLGPPVATYVSNGVYDASADLNSTLWQLSRRPPPGTTAEPPEQVANENAVTDFYIEHPLGEFSDIGRPTPDPKRPNKRKYTYIGGSSDLSHIIFAPKAGFHWPFDNTVNNISTLYEYVGVERPGELSREPMLVGVNGPKGSDELLSECGIRLGASEPSGGGSMYNAISSDGRRVFFTAVGADDRSCGATEPPVDELFVREELPSGEMQTTAISEPAVGHCSPAPTPPCADARFQGASWDGSKVFFTSAQKLLPGAGEGSTNLYEDELSGSGPTLTQTLTLVSSGSAKADVQGVARVSEDGSSVYFVATGKLTGVPNDQGYAAAECEHNPCEDDNLYVFERNERHPEGHTSFIATLSPGDGEVWAQEDSRLVLLSSDDRFLVFSSGSDPTHEGAHGAQIYQYDSQSGVLVRASIGREGYNNDGKTPVFGAVVVNGPPVGYSYAIGDSPTQAAGLFAPADGAVFFQSPDALTPQALNDQFDQTSEPLPVSNVYEYRSGNVYLLSDGRDTSTVNSLPSVSIVASSASGADLFFSIADSLIAQDTDAQQDIYDARVGGGFPLSSPAVCTGEACRGPLSQAPALPEALAAPAAEGVRSAPSAPVVKAAKTKARTKAKRRHGRKRRKRATKAAHGRVKRRTGRG